MAQKFDAVLFDLDGTLLDTHALLMETFRYATQTVLGETIPDEKLGSKIGQSLVTQMWDFTDDPAVHQRLCEAYVKRNAELHDSAIRVFDGIVEMLNELTKAKITLGVVTSKMHDSAAHGLSCFDLNDYFQFIIGPDDWPEHKPSPGPVLHGCDLAEVLPERCLYVGDSPFDMQAGRSAGCSTAAVLWGMFSADRLKDENPTFICEKPSDIVRLVCA